jgi:hypothetical protein
MHATMGDWPTNFKTGIEHEASIIPHRDVFIVGLIEDLKLDNRWWVNGTSIGRS